MTWNTAGRFPTDRAALVTLASSLSAANRCAPTVSQTYPPPESHATDQAHTPSDAASWAAAVRYMSVRWEPRAAEPAGGYGRRPQSLVGAVSLGQEARDFP